MAVRRHTNTHTHGPTLKLSYISTGEKDNEEERKSFCRSRNTSFEFVEKRVSKRTSNGRTNERLTDRVSESASVCVSDSIDGATKLPSELSFEESRRRALKLTKKRVDIQIAASLGYGGGGSSSSNGNGRIRDRIMVDDLSTIHLKHV